MAGFDNDVVYGTNVDFTGTSPVSGQINQNGELLVGATTAPFIRAYVPTGSTGVSITKGPGTIDFSLANVPNSALQNSFINVIAGTGLSGGGAVALGGSVSLQVSGGSSVTSVTGTANRITSTGGTTPAIDISASYVGQSSITTLGTISTGVWNGSLITGTFGGTGVNNGASTITLGGNLTTSGAFASTFTMTNTTSVTFPTAGTLATTAVSGSGTGKASFTAYTVVCGGTTTTGSLQSVASVGTGGQVLTSNDASALPSFQDPQIIVTSVSVTSAQMKALNGTPITLVSAPGATKAIIPVSCMVQLLYGGSNAFTTTSATVQLQINGISMTAVIAAAFLAGTANAYYYPWPLAANATVPSTTIQNQALTINNPGTNIAGNAGNNNHCKFTVSYYII